MRASRARAHAQLDQVVPFEPTRGFLERVDLVNLEIELDVLAQLLHVDPVPLQVRDRVAARGGDQVGERPGDRLGSLEFVHERAANSPWAYRS